MAARTLRRSDLDAPSEPVVCVDLNGVLDS
jgi:hypothetical protein